MKISRIAKKTKNQEDTQSSKQTTNPKNKRLFGQQFERLACEYLQNQNLTVLAQNFQAKVGEIDLIMQDKNILVFVEVRYRKNKNFGGALQSISPTKVRKIIKTARYFLLIHPNFKSFPCRFDIVAIEKNEHNYKLEWIHDAFNLNTGF